LLPLSSIWEVKVIEPIRLLLVGAGNVGRRVLELLMDKERLLQERFDLAFALVGLADSSGTAVRPAGLDLAEVVRLKTAGQGVAAFPGVGRPGGTAQEMVETVPADLLLEAAPANLRDGQPGLGCIEAALQRGMHVVTADKAPLVLAYAHLQELARAHGRQLRFSATVGGGLPAVNLGQRDLAAAEIVRIEGILNLTTNYVLTRMGEGLSYEQALALAQAAGHAETDPRLDVEGWDAASKLVILAHSVLHYPAALAEVEREGITHLTAEDLQEAAAGGKRLKPVAVAERTTGGYRLRVGPTALPAGHPLAALGAEQMGIVYTSDINGQIAASVVEETPLPTAAAMLRDVVEICNLRAL
jgi:homoserine dehydrogenase